MFLTHTTTEGDRWDNIAWRYYRDVTRIPDLVDANPTAPIRETLPSGLVLLIPIIDAADAAPSQDLPPWKR